MILSKVIKRSPVDLIHYGMQDAYGGDEFDEENLSEAGTPGKFIRGRSYAEGRKKHNTG